MSRETLRARLEAATPEPWELERDYAVIGFDPKRRLGRSLLATVYDDGNPALIAHARQDLPALLRVADAMAALPTVFEAGMQDPRALAQWWLTVAQPALAALEALP